MQPDTASAPDGGKGPTRILLVDDHEISRAALRALLRTEGLDVADVRTGDAAITAAIASRPRRGNPQRGTRDPGGSHVARQLRALPDAPLVVFTSSAGRCRFGSQLERRPFVAKADPCARTIENAHYSL